MAETILDIGRNYLDERQVAGGRASITGLFCSEHFRIVEAARALAPQLVMARTPAPGSRTLNLG
jgi:hypothetical protein